MEDGFLLHPTEKKKMKKNERMTMPLAFACPLPTDQDQRVAMAKSFPHHPPIKT